MERWSLPARNLSLASRPHVIAALWDFFGRAKKQIPRRLALGIKCRSTYQIRSAGRKQSVIPAPLALVDAHLPFGGVFVCVAIRSRSVEGSRRSA